MTKRLAPLHPGEVLREEFLVPLGLSSYALAKSCGVSRNRIERLAKEDSPVTADMALRLAKALNTTPEVWLNLQNSYDLRIVQSEIWQELETMVPIVRAKSKGSNKLRRY